MKILVDVMPANVRIDGVTRGVLVLLKFDENILSFIFCGVCPR